MWVGLPSGYKKGMAIYRFTLFSFFPIIKGKSSVPPTLNIHNEGKNSAPHTIFSPYTKGEFSLRTKYSTCSILNFNTNAKI